MGVFLSLEPQVLYNMLCISEADTILRRLSFPAERRCHVGSDEGGHRCKLHKYSVLKGLLRVWKTLLPSERQQYTVCLDDTLEDISPYCSCHVQSLGCIFAFVWCGVSCCHVLAQPPSHAYCPCLLFSLKIGALSDNIKQLSHGIIHI